jgi:outer membrane lipoprotein-sorting protein
VIKKAHITRVLPLLLVFMLVLIAGCSSQDKSASTDPGQTPATQQEKGDTSLADVFAKNKDIKGMSFEMKTTMPEGPALESKMWFKDENLRMETDMPEAGGNVVYIANKADKAMYMYQPAQNIAMKLPYKEEQFSGPQDKAEDVDASKAKYVGKDKIDGKTCLVYELAIEGGKEKIWVWEEYGLPLRMETEVEGQKTIIEYRNVKVGDIDDNMFKLPAGTQIMDMPNMPGVSGTPAMPQP